MSDRYIRCGVSWENVSDFSASNVAILCELSL